MLKVFLMTAYLFLVSTIAHAGDVMPTPDDEQQQEQSTPEEPIADMPVSTIINEYVPDANIVGQGRLYFLLKKVYVARLYAPEGMWRTDIGYERPFALQLTYNMGIEGNAIAERSVEEMRKQGWSDETQLSQWLDEMRVIFPDVEDGTVLTGIYTAEGQTKFFEGTTPIGTIDDPLFGEAFFNIWLSEQTSEPDLRDELLGLE